MIDLWIVLLIKILEPQGVLAYVKTYRAANARRDSEDLLCYSWTLTQPNGFRVIQSWWILIELRLWAAKSGVIYSACWLMSECDAV